MKHAERLPDDSVNVSKRHPLREMVLLLAGLSAAGVLAFWLLGALVDVAVDWVPLETEATLLAELPLDDVLSDGSLDEARSKALSRRLAALAVHWPEDPYEHGVVVIPDEQPNAFAVPGGLVLVTEGLLELTGEGPALDFVLAHELGHFRHRDHLRGLGRSLVFGLAMNAVGLSDGSWLAERASRFADRAHGRDQERAADAFALEVLWREHGDVSPALDFLRGLPPEAGPDGALGSFVSTHPGLAEREATVRAWDARQHHDLR